MFVEKNWDEGVMHYTITAGSYTVGIISLGASLQSYKYKDTDVVLGFDNTHAYKAQDCFIGQIVGPFANRIKDATFKLDGKTYNLDKNDNENSLHSGSKNFGIDNWSLKDHSDNSVTLALVSTPKGGFDQTHNVEVKYTLNCEGELAIEYKMTSDKKTPVNLTNHAYFNLGGGDVRESYVQFTSSKYIAVDKLLIPTDVADSTDTIYDFNKKTQIFARNNGQYDNCFILEKGSVVIENNGLRLSMTTDLPAFQLYTGIVLKTDLPGKEGKPYKNFDGFALESSYYPDFVNRPEFPGAYINPGETYYSRTVYKLEKI